MASLPQPKLLLVEDSGFFRRALAVSLVSEGYEVVSATNGDEAIRLAQTEAPNLILLDLFMPKLNGIMVLRLLRADPKTRSIPVIILSADDENQDMNTAMNLGIAAYCGKKEMTLQKLLATITHSLETDAAAIRA